MSVPDTVKNDIEYIRGDLSLRIAEDSVDSNITYIGKAGVGALDSDAFWQIRKMDETSGTTVTWANGNSNFDNIWDNRESISYS